MTSKQDEQEEKEDVLRRLRALEAQVGAVRSTLPESTNYDEAKEQVQRRLDYLQSLTEGASKWK